MPKNKLYAVRSGRAPGIYGTWEECHEQVDGYPGAEFKSFRDRDAAEEYMDNGGAGKDVAHAGREYPLAFVDGSYNPDTKTYGYGGFVSVSQSETYEISGSGSDAEKASMRNVAGEIDGAVAAVEKAVALGLKKIAIYHDYEGVAKWADGSWRCNKPATKAYREAMLRYGSEIEIRFVHVDAHTGIAGNELADRMAKRAVGLDPKRPGTEASHDRKD